VLILEIALGVGLGILLGVSLLPLLPQLRVLAAVFWLIVVAVVIVGIVGVTGWFAVTHLQHVSSLLEHIAVLFGFLVAICLPLVWFERRAQVRQTTGSAPPERSADTAE